MDDSINITLIRRQNLLSLFQEFAEQHMQTGGSPKGVEQLFAQHLQMLPSRFSQIKSSRPIGDKLAHQIESICKRPQGWLDAAHDTQAPTPAEESFIAMAREVWRKQNSKGKRQLTKHVRDFV